VSHGLASGDATVASRMTELTGHVIRAWRRLAGLDEQQVRETSLAYA
jgi:hypothetical protein